MKQSMYEKDLTKQDVVDHLKMLGIRRNSKSWADYEVVKASHWVQWTPEVVRWITEYLGL